MCIYIYIYIRISDIHDDGVVAIAATGAITH